MNGEPTWILDVPLGDSGLTVRHATVAAFLVVMVITVLATLWNGRPGRRTCGAPRRGNAGRCRRPVTPASKDCGVHSGGWVARDVVLGILLGIGGSLVFWNFEAVIAGVGSIMSDALA